MLKNTKQVYENKQTKKQKVPKKLFLKVLGRLYIVTHSSTL